MERIGVLFVFLSVALAVLILGGVYGDALVRRVGRRGPEDAVGGDVLILWGLLVLAAFVLGLFVMFLVIDP